MASRDQRAVGIISNHPAWVLSLSKMVACNNKREGSVAAVPFGATKASSGLSSLDAGRASR
jgi:hypothetical protein